MSAPLANPQLIFIQVLSTCHNWLKKHITPRRQRPLYHVALRCTSKSVWPTLLITDDPQGQFCNHQLTTREGDTCCDCYKRGCGGQLINMVPTSILIRHTKSCLQCSYHKSLAQTTCSYHTAMSNVSMELHTTHVNGVRQTSTTNVSSSSPQCSPSQFSLCFIIFNLQIY